MRATRTQAAIAAAVLLASALVALPAGAATTPSLSISASTAKVKVGRTFTLFGHLRPAQRNVTVTRQVWRDSGWRSTGSTRTNGKGDWKMVVTAPAWPEALRLRVRATVRGERLTSEVAQVAVVRSLGSTPTPSPTPTPTPTPSPTPSPDTSTVVDTTTVTDTSTAAETITAIELRGPGKRILGADISRWQHPTSLLFPDGAPIDFTAMYKAGARFVIIKASDGRDAGHDNAAKWFARDRADAQAAGLFTGFYHYAYFPATTDAAAIIADATAQADKAVWRVAAVGGYTSRDLPLALDLEEWCVSTAADGSCSKSVTQASATLWTKTWLARVEQRTGRKPIVYSSPAFLAKYLARDVLLRTYPVWMAHYGPDPKVLTNFPGMKADGTCYITAWTVSPCTTQWTMWQYTSSASAAKFGIAGGNLDLNVFAGSSDEFLTLTSGTWVPQEGDFLPFNETSTATVSALAYSVIGKPLTFTVDVRRITGAPVVSGSVAFTLLADATGVAPTPVQMNAIRQTVKRIATGTWTVSVSGLPAGSWLAQVAFRDPSGVHAPSVAPIVFSLVDPNPPAPVDTSTVTAAGSDTGTATP